MTITASIMITYKFTMQMYTIKHACYNCKCEIFLMNIYLSGKISILIENVVNIKGITLFVSCTQ